MYGLSTTREAAIESSTKPERARHGPRKTVYNWDEAKTMIDTSGAGAGPGLQVRRGECSPQDSQASTISLDTIEQWQPSAGGAPQASVDDRITEILVTLNSLSAELANISRARQQESSERLSVESTTTIPRETNDGENVTEEAAFQHWRSSCTTVKLNVGGKVFHVSWSLMLQVGRRART